MKAKDGGPAFPMQPYRIDLGDGGYSENVFPQFGMTLRDYFAGQALVGIAHAERMMGAYRYEEEYPDLARLAYGVADAMLKAREEEV